MAKSSVRVCGAFPKAQRALIQFCTPLALVFPRSHIFPRGNKSTWRSHSPSAAHPSLACRHEGTRPRGNMPCQHHSRSDPTVRSALGQAPTDKELREMISQVDIDQVRVPAVPSRGHSRKQHPRYLPMYQYHRLNTWYVFAAYRALPPALAAALVRERSIHPRSAPNRGVRPVAERHYRLLGISAPSHEEHAHDRLCRGNVVRIPDLRSGYVAPHSPITRSLCHTRRT